MRIGRVDHGGSVRAAIIDGEVVRIFGHGVDVLEILSADAVGRERLAGRVEAELALDEAHLLAPVEPPTMRDFSVFEQHIEGVIKDANPGATVPPVWYESPFCYFTNPHALSGPGEDIPVPPGCRRLDFELEVAAVIGRAGRNLTPAESGEHIAGYTIFNDWSARDLQMAEMRLGLGMCKGKDFANTLGPWIVTADELEPNRDGIGSIWNSAPRLTAAGWGSTPSPTWRGAFPSSCPMPPGVPGSGPATCSARARAATAACSSCGGGAALRYSRRSGRAT